MDMQITIKRKLYSPQELKERLPMTERMLKIKEERDNIIADILSGKSKKIMLIIGPCSS